MSDTNELLKSLKAQIEKANSDFNAKAESALTEAQKAGGLSAETKEAVDKMALELNALREAEKTIKSAMGELEQHIAQMPLQNALKAAQSFGQQLISAEVLKDINSSIQGNKRISVPVQAALISTGVAEGVVEPHRLPGVDVAPKQRLFIRDLIAPEKRSHRQSSGFSRPDLPIRQQWFRKIPPSLTVILSLQPKSPR